MVTKKQLIISLLFNGANAIMFLYYIYDIYLRPVDLEHITRITYYLNCIFTTICLICDISLYYLKIIEENMVLNQNYKLMNENEEKGNFFENLNDFNRNKIGVIFNPFSYFVSIGFWSLYFFGNKIMLVSKNVRSWYNAYYHHLIIQIIILIDIFASNRKQIKFCWKEFGIIWGIFAIYCLGITFEKYFLQRNAYYFMEGKSFIFLIFCFAITSFFLYICYVIHIYLIEFKINRLNNNDEENRLNACNKLLNSLDNENHKKFIEENKV